MDLSSTLALQQPLIGLTNPVNVSSYKANGVNSATDSDAKLKKVCGQLEGVFFNMMLKEMRKTIDKSSLLPDSEHQQEIFQGMMDEHLSQDMADNDKTTNGLSSMLYQQLSGRRAYASSKSKLNPLHLTGEQTSQAAETSKGATRQ